jgi:GrpB-like predicted nucleotidyltransferase (UPF0157 family)
MASGEAGTPPTTDEYIARTRVGVVRLHNGPVILAEYDDAWPERYAGLEHEIREVLRDEALLVEHVGSTSVPSLVAKPIIDIVLVVADSARERDYVPPLEAAGYALRVREPGWYEHRMLVAGNQDVQVHVFSTGCPEVERMLGFRDRLRTDPKERNLYAGVKRELAARHWRHVQHYADAKSAVVDEIVTRASG